MNEKRILASLCFLASSPSIQFSQFPFVVLPLTSPFNQAVAKGVTVGIKAQTGRVWSSAIKSLQMVVEFDSRT
jgi:hypothetical protein